MRHKTTEANSTPEKNSLSKTAFTLGFMYFLSREALPATGEITHPLLQAAIGDGVLYSLGNIFLYIAGLKMCSVYTENVYRLSRSPIESAKNWAKARTSDLYLSGSRYAANVGAYMSPSKYYFHLGEDYFSHQDFEQAIQYFRKIPKPEKLVTPVFSRENHLIETIDELIQKERRGELPEGALENLTLDERLWARAQHRIDQVTILKIEITLNGDPETITPPDEQSLKIIIHNNSNLAFDATLLLARCYIFCGQFLEAFEILSPHKSKISEFLKKRLELLEQDNLPENKKSVLLTTINRVAKTEYQPVNELLLLLARFSMGSYTESQEEGALKAGELALAALMDCRLDEYHFIKANIEFSKFKLLRGKIGGKCTVAAFSEEILRLVRLMAEGDELEILRLSKSIKGFVSHYATSYYKESDQLTLKESLSEITKEIDQTLLREQKGSSILILKLIKMEIQIYQMAQATGAWSCILELANKNRGDQRFDQALSAYKLTLLKMRCGFKNEEVLDRNRSYLLSNYRCAEILGHLVQFDKKISENKRALMLEEALQYLSVVDTQKDQTISESSSKSFEQVAASLREKLNRLLPSNAEVEKLGFQHGL